MSGCANDLILVDPDEGPVGDDGIVEPNPNEPTEPTEPGGETELVAHVCEYRVYPSYKHDGPDVDLAAAPTTTGAAIFSVARAGGPIRGLALDHRRNIVGERAGVIVSDEREYRSVSASYLHEHLITAGLASDADEAVFTLHRMDLGEHVDISRTPATLLADAAMLPSTGDRIAAFADRADITATRFGADWKVSDQRPVARADLESLTAAQFLGDAAVSWSTGESCHVQQLANDSDHAAIERAFPCHGARLAVDEKFSTGHLVFEQDGALMIADVTVIGQGHTRVQLAAPRVLATGAYAPRITWDGDRYWLAYLDERGFPIVGFLEDGRLRRLGIHALSPLDQAFDLTVIDGQVWMYSIDRLGLVGAHLCAVAPAPPA